MPINWEKMTDEDKERLLQIVKRAKTIQNKFDILVDQLCKERNALTSELVDICRGCNDENCFSNDDCEVKKAYTILKVRFDW